MSVFDKFLNAIKLNDDYDEDEFYDDYDDELLDEDEDVKPRKSFFDKFKGKRSDEDDFEDELDESPMKKTAARSSAATKTSAASASSSRTSSRAGKTTSSKVTPMRSSSKRTSSMEVCVIKPVSMEDTREIADTLLDNCTVVLNLEGVDVDLAQRIIDFTSGSCYSLGGALQKISSYIFIITPRGVDVSGDFQSILGDAIPSIRSAY